MIIQSSLLHLRKTEADDVAFVIETESNPDNTPFIGQWPLEWHLQALSNPDMLHLIIANNEGHRAGYAILSGLADPNKAVCIQRITIRAKGRGYGKEAMRLLVKWVFEHTDSHRIWLDVKEFNRRARHVYESVGFIHEGTLRDSLLNGEKFESLAVMSILRHEYMR